MRKFFAASVISHGFCSSIAKGDDDFFTSRGPPPNRRGTPLYHHVIREWEREGDISCVGSGSDGANHKEYQ